LARAWSKSADQVLRSFYAAAHPDQVVGDAEPFPVLAPHPGV
jgi:hypothetical protein